MSGLRTRKPSGQVAWPLILVEGAEKTGKSAQSYSLSADPRVGRTFVLDIGEGTADEYARLGPYEVIEHNGTYTDMWEQLGFACKEPSPAGRPNVIEIDAGSNLWDLLKDWTNHRARNSKTGRKKLEADPDAEIDPSMNLWNDARDRWYRIINQLRRSGCIGVIICRAREVAKVKDGQPVANETDYKVEAEKGTPFAATAQVRMTKPHKATLVAVRSLDVDVPEKGIALPDVNPLGHLVFDLLGCGEGTVAANITHGVVGLPTPEAKNRLLDLVSRHGYSGDEAKAKAAELWTLPPGAEVAPAALASVLDAAAEALDKNTTEKGAGADGPASDGDAGSDSEPTPETGPLDAASSDGADSHDVGRSVPEPAPATPKGNGGESALHGSDPDSDTPAGAASQLKAGAEAAANWAAGEGEG